MGIGKPAAPTAWIPLGPALLAALALGFAAGTAAGQDSYGGAAGGYGNSSGGDDGPPVSVSAQFTAAKGGQPAELFISAVVKAGWHIYSLTQPKGGPLASKIDLKKSADYQTKGDFQASPAADKKKEPAFDNLVVETHSGSVTWHAPIELAAGVEPGKLTIEGSLSVQACDANNCMPPHDYPFTARLGAGVKLADSVPPPSAPPTPRATAPEVPIAASAPPAEAPPVAAAPPPAVPPAASGDAKAAIDWQPFTTVADLGQRLGPAFDLNVIHRQVQAEFGKAATLRDTIAWMCLGFVGGLILNIMPCVLPVIGLKILSFIEQSGHDRGKAFLLNVYYSAGLLAVFALLATLAAGIGMGGARLEWGGQFTYKAFFITLTAVVFVMGLSFLGIWELPIPGFAGRGKMSELAAQEGAVGAFVKGAFTTLLATPCSAPFLGPALTWAVAQPPALTYAVLLSAGLGMASPYLLIGAFPELMRFLPKPGAWMDTFKQIMGFVLLGTVAFLLSSLDAPLVVPTVSLLFALWAGCWWIGRVSPLADGGTRVRAWMEAAAFVGLMWILLFPGTRGLLPDRFAFGGLVESMQERFSSRVRLEAAKLAVNRVAVARTGPQTVLVDFTANWCLSCKALEKAVLNRSDVISQVNRSGVVALQADWTNRDPEVTRMLQTLGANMVPVIAIFPARDPSHPIVFRGGYTQQGLLDALAKATAM
jgi:suppressor for copper-sensitivity B